MRFLDKLTANKIRDGDVGAFEKLINTHKNGVFNYCLRMVGCSYLIIPPARVWHPGNPT